VYRLDPIEEKDREKDGPTERVTFARTGTHADLFE
jgi:hypothetical protein